MSRTATLNGTPARPLVPLVVSQKPPLVSIGVPLYNAELFVREALESLLAQDYANFELIISDNASTDATADICREYAARDRRVRYHRADQNMGAVWNFRRVLELACGEYFMWAAYDDLRAPQYLRRCVEALEAHPSAVMCCTDIRVIDERGRELRPEEFPYGIRMAGESVRKRVRAIARSYYWYDFYGLIRRGALAQTRPPQPVWGFDLIVMMELALLGRVLLVPEPLFSYRVIRGRTGADAASTLAPAEAPAPMDWMGLVYELCRSIWRAPLGRVARLGLMLEFLFDFCLRNYVVRTGIYGQGLSGAAHIWDQGRYARSAGALALAAVVLPLEAVNRLLRPLRFRFFKP